MTIEALDNLGIGYAEGKTPLREDDPTLVMIHGAGGNSQIWSLQLQSLSNEINTVAIDLPGHGKSGKESLDTIDEYSNWLVNALESWLKSPAYIMGNSMGGAIAQKIAIENANLLKGLILVATGSLLKVAPQFLSGLLKDFENTVDTIMGYAYSKNTHNDIIAQGARMMKESGSAVVYNDFSACNSFDSRGDLNTISTPCLIICGEDDKLTPPKASKNLHENIKNSTLKIIPQAGHMVMIEKHEEVNRLILEFVRNTI